MNALRILVAVAVIFVLSALWVYLQERGRQFARKHPELGRYREEGGECGKTCNCANWARCRKKFNRNGSRTALTGSEENPSEHSPP